MSRVLAVSVASLLLTLQPVLAQELPTECKLGPSPDSTVVVCTLIDDNTCPCSGGQLELQADYLLWWMKGPTLGPALVTTDPTNGATATAGGLADPATQVLIGGRTSYDAFSGARLRGAYSFSEGLAIEGSGFFTGTQVRNFSAASDAGGNPFLFRPFVNVDTGNANAGSIVALPGLLSGAVNVASQSQLWGTDFRLAGNLAKNDLLRLDGFVGFRYLDLDEKLEINDARTDQVGIGSFGGTATLPGDRFMFVDSFKTRNQFYGGEMGLRGDLQCGPFVITSNVGVSLGDSHQVVDVAGTTTLLPAAGGTATLPGGILALPSNSGRFVYQHFAAVPEARVQLGYDVCSWLRIGAGYDFLYWSNVVRPGDQVVPVLSAAQLPSSASFGTGGTAVPAPQHSTSDFWAQGVSFYVGLHY